MKGLNAPVETFRRLVTPDFEFPDLRDQDLIDRGYDIEYRRGVAARIRARQQAAVGALEFWL